MAELSPTELEKLSIGQLLSLHDRGIISVMLNMPMPNRKEDTPEYQHASKLSGIKIHMGEAERKYNIPHQTISRWVKRGYIKTLGRDGNKVLLNEADVAYCAEVYKRRGSKGRWLFDPEGRPYQPKK